METGFVVVETAQSIKDGSFYYGLGAIDCDRWIVNALAGGGQTRNYSILTKWKTDPRASSRMPRDSHFDFVARNLCPDYYNFPRGNIPK